MPRGRLAPAAQLASPLLEHHPGGQGIRVLRRIHEWGPSPRRFPSRNTYPMTSLEFRPVNIPMSCFPRLCARYRESLLPKLFPFTESEPRPSIFGHLASSMGAARVPRTGCGGRELCAARWLSRVAFRWLSPHRIKPSGSSHRQLEVVSSISRAADARRVGRGRVGYGTRCSSSRMRRRRLGLQQLDGMGFHPASPSSALKARCKARCLAVWA